MVKVFLSVCLRVFDLIYQVYYQKKIYMWSKMTIIYLVSSKKELIYMNYKYLYIERHTYTPIYMCMYIYDISF